MSDPEPYRLTLTENAKADLKKLDKATAERILKKMIWVAENAAILNHEALKGEWSGAYRRRIGDYRVIYAIDHETKSVVADVIGHRRDVYIE